MREHFQYYNLHYVRYIEKQYRKHIIHNKPIFSIAYELRRRFDEGTIGWIWIFLGPNS